MSQSKAELNSDKQILYLVQWFAEFSEFQRKDFFHDYLIQLYWQFFQQNLFKTKVQNDSDNLLIKNDEKIEEKKAYDSELLSNYLNSLTLLSRPPSIFQCRMKLFKEWFETQWNDQDRIEFLFRLKNVDPEFVWNLYRLILKQQNLLDREKFSKLIKESNDSVKKNLAERLDLFNEVIFLKSNSDINPPADLTVNGFNHPEAKHAPDLLANCHNEENSNDCPLVSNESESRNEPENKLEYLEAGLSLIKESPPDLLA